MENSSFFPVFENKEGTKLISWRRGRQAGSQGVAGDVRLCPLLGRDVSGVREPRCTATGATAQGRDKPRAAPTGPR